MNDCLLSVVLGIVEGLTEFLPVSSTAHLRIVEALFKIDLSDGYWKMYTVVIQLGAILCLPVYFRARIAAFISSFPKEGRARLVHPLSLSSSLIVDMRGDLPANNGSNKTHEALRLAQFPSADGLHHHQKRVMDLVVSSCEPSWRHK